jgi:hypothetical protein
MQFLKKYFLFSLLLLFSCSKNGIWDDPQCIYNELGVTSLNSEVYPSSVRNPVDWQGKYSEQSVEVNYNYPTGFEGQNDTFGFVFKKEGSCINFDYSYSNYDDPYTGFSFVKPIEIDSFELQEYIEDIKIVGQITFYNPYTRETETKKFWYIYSTEDYFDTNTTYVTFNNCTNSSIPISIDLNNDNIDDFSITSDEDNSPDHLIKYSIEVFSLNNNIILSNTSLSPYKIIFEPPFSSSNKREDNSYIENTLAVFAEYQPPLDNFNHWITTNWYGYYIDFINSIDDYIIVKVEKDGLFYYGWIKIRVNYEDCIFEVVETYLNAIPNEHVSVP